MGNNQHNSVNTVEFDGPVALIGGVFAKSRGPKPEIDSVVAVIGVDGGADAALATGLPVDMIVGDMDSFTGSYDGRVVHLSEQDTTDFEKCLYTVKAPLYIGYGFLGGRLDHELAALSVLARYSDRVVILVGEKDICFRCPAEFKIDIEMGARFSVFPMGNVAMRSRGLEWPLDGLHLSPTAQIAISNKASGDQVTLNVDQGDALVMVPVSYLDAVKTALAGG